jgi:hypothetical protein
MAELIKHLNLTVKSDKVNFNSDTNVSVFEVPGDILIRNISVNVVTAYEASGSSAAATATIEVPGDTGAIVVFDAGSTLLQTATTDVMLPSTNAGPIHVASSGGVIAVKQAPGTTTAGQLEVYLTYVPNVTIL